MDTEDYEFRQKLLLMEGSAFHVAQDIDLRISDLQPGLLPQHTVDGLHPDIEGQQLLGRNLAKLLETL